MHKPDQPAGAERPDQPLLRIGHFPSTPWAPYYAPPSLVGSTLVRCVSSQVRVMALAGQLDVTPMATVDWLDCRDRFERIGSFGLGYRERAQSVLLFSSRPLDELGGCTIAVSRETSTSVRVLRALLRHRHGLRLGPLVPMAADVPDSVPRLLIQDEAIEESRRARFPHVVDLGEQWWAWQRLPVVSAVWVARRGLRAGKLAAVTDWLEAALAAFAREPLAHARRFAATADLAIGAEQVVALCRRFVFRLGPLEEQGIAMMQRLLESREEIDRAYAVASAGDAGTSAPST